VKYIPGCNLALNKCIKNPSRYRMGTNRGVAPRLVMGRRYYLTI
jgi:hypothetical protein